MSEPQIPLATYRLQFNKDFRFDDAAQLAPYLASLGVSHCYASPYLRARPGSTHGYDIIDHNSLNPEIGTPEDFERFVSALHENGLGQILDIVPNHMGVMGSDNAWWLDVLENGEASNFADFFDIDWQSLKDELQGKVLIPVLGDQYGDVLDRGELKLTFDCPKGEFSIVYSQHRFPVNPGEYSRILNHNISLLEQRLDAQNTDLLELQSLIAAFGHLPSRLEIAPEKRAERNRDKEIHKHRLATLCAQSTEVCGFIDANVREINGVAGNSRSFDTLHELIKVQAYRLAYWRVASDDINYRRFFDVNELAGIRQENRQVFEATHRFVLELLSQGKLNGLRVDHPDGLYDPSEYFHRLQCGRSCPPSAQPCESQRFYVVAEKILTGDEQLPEDWPVYGTTGYDFLNLVNGLFVDPSANGRMDRAYWAFAGAEVDFAELSYRCKKLVMRRALASELNVLANLLSQIALANRHTCDFTVNSLRDALREIIARFPVYRTYITEAHISNTDRGRIDRAVFDARREGSVADASVFDFIRSVLLTQAAEGHTESYRAAVFRFAMKFQQFTSVVMAKGLEDTAFYRFNKLVSLNEVGGDPRRFGVTPEEFHSRTQQRARTLPHSMLTTSTHDTKRSEDVRARINVLSEFPALWRRSVKRWKELNRSKKTTVEGCEAPTRNDEYLFYQALIGIWPFDARGAATVDLVSRLRDYMLKAVREAKNETSWSHQHPEYEASVTRFVESVLCESNRRFWEDFIPFQQRTALLGMFNSLAQTLIKLTAPGVPDLYQGSELWDFSLVDPDNRRPVDYQRRQQLLNDMQQSFAERPESPNPEQNRKSLLGRLINHMKDGRIKLFVTWKTLELRKRYPLLFQEGRYIPLRCTGTKAEHVVAFARQLETSLALVVVPRLIGKLLGEWTDPIIAEMWGDTSVELPFQTTAPFRNIFTSRKVDVSGKSALVSELLDDFPVGFLVHQSANGGEL